MKIVTCLVCERPVEMYLSRYVAIHVDSSGGTCPGSLLVNVRYVPRVRRDRVVILEGTRTNVTSASNRAATRDVSTQKLRKSRARSGLSSAA
jgi:hypothetical protein